MASFYFKYRDGIIGPLTGAELREAAFARWVRPDTLIAARRPGPWVRAAQAKNLFDLNDEPLPHPPGTTVPVWYIKTEAGETGPLHLHQVLKLKVTPTSLVRQSDDTSRTTWMLAGRASRLLRAASSSDELGESSPPPVPKSPGLEARLDRSSAEEVAGGSVMPVTDDEILNILESPKPAAPAIVASGTEEEKGDNHRDRDRANGGVANWDSAEEPRLGSSQPTAMANARQLPSLATTGAPPAHEPGFSAGLVFIITLTLLKLGGDALIAVGCVSEMIASPTQRAEYLPILVIFVAVPNIACILTGAFARSKGYSFWCWFLAGGLIIVSLPALLFLPNIRDGGSRAGNNGNAIGGVTSSFVGLFSLLCLVAGILQAIP